MSLIIAPSILACDLTRLGEQVKAAEAAGADWHHLDVMDGHFVPNMTFGIDICQAIKRAGTRPIDVHLMIEDPYRYAPDFIAAGADVVTFHIEVEPDPRQTIRLIREKGARPGLVVRPKTPISAIFPWVKEIDFCLIMTVEPGFTAQSFMPDCVAKIAELRRRVGPEFDIEVDGGLNGKTVCQTAAAGANVTVAGAAVYRQPDMKAAVASIRRAMQENYRSAPE